LAISTTERAAFLKVARAELAVDQLDLAVQPPDWLEDAPHSTSLPSGTVTFLFTDIQCSTALWERHPQAMGAVLARHEALLRNTCLSMIAPLAIFGSVENCIIPFSPDGSRFRRKPIGG
jgi:hypothetical protein